MLFPQIPHKSPTSDLRSSCNYQLITTATTTDIQDIQLLLSLVKRAHFFKQGGMECLGKKSARNISAPGN